MISKAKENGRTAFTLVEVLVVIGIVALLAAILFPVLAGAREKARQATCLSNLRQIGAATLLYRQDYDGRLPVAADTAAHGVTLWHSEQDEVHRLLRTAPTFKTVMMPFVKSEDVWKCPSDVGGGAGFTPAADIDSDPEVYQSTGSLYSLLGSSYCYRSEAGFVANIEAAPAVDDTKKPLGSSQIVIAAEFYPWHFSPHRNALKDYFFETTRTPAWQNLLFADGDVKNMSSDYFASNWLGNLGVR